MNGAESGVEAVEGNESGVESGERSEEGDEESEGMEVPGRGQTGRGAHEKEVALNGAGDGQEGPGEGQTLEDEGRELLEESDEWQVVPEGGDVGQYLIRDEL